MNKDLTSTLEEWLSQSDRGAWLRAHPEHAESLAPYLGLDTAVQASARETCVASEPSASTVAAGHTRLMAEVKAMPKATGFSRWTAPARAGAMAVVAVAALTMAVGASAAFGGGDLGKAVLDAVVGPNQDERDHEEGINNAPPEADNGREHANDNAFEGGGNAEDKAANGAGCEPGDNADVNPKANPNAAERCDNADDGQGNAGDNPGAGADNASQGSGNVDGHPSPPPHPDVPAAPPGRGR